jgi:hypothetical protein
MVAAREVAVGEKVVSSVPGSALDRNYRKALPWRPARRPTPALGSATREIEVPTLHI